LQCLFDRALRTCKFFPTIAEILGQIESANSAGLELEAAEAWDNWLAHVQKFFHPDLGWDRRTRPLEAITEHDGRAAGGACWVEGCPESELQWARKRFIDSYLLAHRTGQVENLLTRGEAKKILKSLTAKAPAKQLPRPASPSASGPESTKPDNETVRILDDAFQKISTPKPILEPLSEEEWERRKRTQKDALARYLKSQEMQIIA